MSALSTVAPCPMQLQCKGQLQQACFETSRPQDTLQAGRSAISTASRNQLSSERAQLQRACRAQDVRATRMPVHVTSPCWPAPPRLIHPPAKQQQRLCCTATASTSTYTIIAKRLCSKAPNARGGVPLMAPRPAPGQKHQQHITALIQSRRNDQALPHLNTRKRAPHLLLACAAVLLLHCLQDA